MCSFIMPATDKIKGLKCKECGKCHFPAKATHVCDECFGPA